jgi:uncharacterized protein
VEVAPRRCGGGLTEVERERAAEFTEALHRAQERLYAGEAVDPVRSLLCPDVVWRVPGRTPIAGDHQGIENVIAYMLRRRDLADRTLRMHRRELLVGEGEHFAALTDGSAVIAGRAREWSTIGLYRLRGDRLAECRLLPFDQTDFDSIWNCEGGPGGEERGTEAGGARAGGR